MTSIRLTIRGADAQAEVDGLLVAGMVGVPIEISYDSAWDGLTKTLVSRCGRNIATVLGVSDQTTLPPGVMTAGRALELGVEGRNADDTLVIPTVWASCGIVLPGADPNADPSTAPDNPVWAQILSMIGSLDDLDTDDKSNLVAAINEALASGGVDAEELQRLVEEYLTANPPKVEESDPTVPDWAKAAQKPSYTASEVGADPTGTASSAVSAHNTDTAAHNDLRLELKELGDRLNAFMDSDDATLDQLSEIVDYIKSNKTLIEAVATSKVSVSDIVDDLVTNVSNKPLSAAQGVVLAGLIEELRGAIPDTYTRTEIDAIMGSYITDIDTLIGGDS